MAAEEEKRLKLPDSLISPSDLSKAIRELESVNDFLRQAKVRAPGTSVTPPKTSQSLTDLSEDNGISLLNQAKRDKLREELKLLLDSPAKVHISFASTPSASFLREIVSWLRKNVHGYALVEVGLQPSIAAGCVLRTQNKVFDLSLRNRFNMSRGTLAKALEQNG